MGMFNIVKNAKEIHRTDLLMFKIGIFYSCYGRDSYVLSYLMNYKIIIVEDMCSCFFPEAAYNRVLSTLENNKINYMVLDKKNNYFVLDKADFKNLNNYTSTYSKAKDKMGLRIRTEKIKKYLEQCKDEKTIFEIERVINERRKIQSN